MNPTFLLLLTALILAGCAGQWIRVSSDETYRTARYEVTLPSDWVKRSEENALILSRDGPDLQKIVIIASEHENAFPKIEENATQEMLPSELSAMFIAELKKESSDGFPGLRIETNEPFNVDGQEGFHLVASYRNDDGIRYRLKAFGVSTEKGYFALSYTAPIIHYYAKDLQAFRKILSGLSLL